MLCYETFIICEQPRMENMLLILPLVMQKFYIVDVVYTEEANSFCNNFEKYIVVNSLDDFQLGSFYGDQNHYKYLESKPSFSSNCKIGKD